MRGGFLRLVLAITIAFPATPAFAATNSSGPIVNLGYARYRGYHDADFGLNVWKGMRYAAPPVGKLRWQAPQPPLLNSSRVTPAVDPPPVCPQTGAFGLRSAYGFNSGLGNEDCLYLNVYAPPNATKLPVFLWIHGGGNSLFGASIYDPRALINTNNNGFVVVMVQYRLGAFGYLASPEVKANGVLNAGLLDQRFAMQWVKKHISKFGGDNNSVTIGGESSGAGSVMYHAMAYGGKKTNLFNNIIAASPWAPPAHRYDDSFPIANYDAFSRLNASGLVSTTRGYFGSFAFGPVVDDDYIQSLPSKQLLSGQVAGKRILVGNNANEGVPLTNPEVNTTEAYNDFVSNTFPNLNLEDIGELNSIYQINQSEPGSSGVRYDTLGDQGPTALTVSEMATGLQQTVFNIAAESLFDCPAQWLAEAFSCSSNHKNHSRQAWKYQYSVTPAYHGADLTAYFSVGAETPNADFMRAFQKIWGNFIVSGSPVISMADATAGFRNATAPADDDGHGDNIQWPAYTLSEPYQMDLNTTGGDVTLVTVTPDLRYYQRTGSGIVNTFRLVNATSWEGGRGARCSFWRDVAPRVPF